MKIKEINIFKSKGLVFAQFWSKFKNSTSGLSTTTRALFQIYFIQNYSNICWHFSKNMNGWSGKSKILCIEQSGRAEKNTRKQKFCLSSPSQCIYFPNIFLSPGYLKIFAAVFFQDSVQLVPSLYHILQQACQNTNWILLKL